jgi:hypothetical protein
VKHKILLSLCWILFAACPASTTSTPATQPSSEPQSGPVLPPKSPLLAPLGAGLGSETRSLLRFVPPQAQLVVLGDLERLVKGPLWKTSEGFLKKLTERPEFVDFVKEAGFHPLQELRGGVLVLGDTSQEKTPSLLILRARYDTKKLTAYLDKIELPKEEPLYLFARGSAVALPAPEIILLGDPAMVREAAQLKTDAMPPALQELFGQLDPARPFSFALRLTSASRAALVLPPEFDGATGGAGWLDLSAGLEVKAFLTFQTPEQARLVLEDIERTWPIERQALLRRGEDKFFEKLRFSVEESRLHIAWELSSGDVLRFSSEVLGFNPEGLLKAYRVDLPKSQPQSDSLPATAPAMPKK